MGHATQVRLEKLKCLIHYFSRIFDNSKWHYFSSLRIFDNTKYSKTCLKRPLKNRQKKILTTNGSLMKVESIAECSLGAFCNTFDLH